MNARALWDSGLIGGSFAKAYHNASGHTVLAARH